METPQALEGIRVVDLTQFISGSRCTQLLADMGAQVVHVEPPGGQTLRLIFSLIPGAERNFSIFNRNKYGLALDWRKPKGRHIIERLAASADIFVHNLVPGTLDTYGLGYGDLVRIKPDIIYAAISGFGAQGVNPGRSAFDIIAQATSGQFWNELDDLKPPANYWADLVSGAYGANAVLIALVHRLRSGEGQFIDISMQDVLYSNNYRAMVNRCMAPVMSDVVERLGREPSDVLNSGDRMPFYGFFKAQKGKVAIVAITSRQWRSLAEVVGAPELVQDERFSSLIAQIHHHEEAVRLIESWTIRRDAGDILRLLDGANIPCGIAYDIDQVNEDPNLASRGMFASADHSVFGELALPGIPYHFSRTPGRISMAGPSLGEHNEHILREWLGYGDEEIASLRTERVI